MIGTGTTRTNRIGRGLDASSFYPLHGVYLPLAGVLPPAPRRKPLRIPHRGATPGTAASSTASKPGDTDRGLAADPLDIGEGLIERATSRNTRRRPRTRDRCDGGHRCQARHGADRAAHPARPREVPANGRGRRTDPPPRPGPRPPPPTSAPPSSPPASARAAPAAASSARRPPSAAAWSTGRSSPCCSTAPFVAARSPCSAGRRRFQRRRRRRSHRAPLEVRPDRGACGRAASGRRLRGRGPQPARRGLTRAWGFGRRPRRRPDQPPLHRRLRRGRPRGPQDVARRPRRSRRRAHRPRGRLRQWLGRKHKVRTGKLRRFPADRLWSEYGLTHLAPRTASFPWAKA